MGTYLVVLRRLIIVLFYPDKSIYNNNMLIYYLVTPWTHYTSKSPYTPSDFHIFVKRGSLVEAVQQMWPHLLQNV